MQLGFLEHSFGVTVDFNVYSIWAWGFIFAVYCIECKILRAAFVCFSAVQVSTEHKKRLQQFLEYKE